MNSVKGRPHYYSTKREEYAHVTFDLDADLSTLFNWNTKQIFLYITASYPSASPSTIPPSEAVIWDAIIPADDAPAHPNTYVHPDRKAKKAPAGSRNKKRATKKAAKGKPYPAGTKPGILRLASQKPKYQITDVSGKIASRGNATLTLHWNIQPYVGALIWSSNSPITKAVAWRWSDLVGGQSEVFEFPPLLSAENVKKEDLKTEKGGEAHRLMAG
jgi:hypothetical protein